jgi:hypothetical protein
MVSENIDDNYDFRSAFALFVTHHEDTTAFGQGANATASENGSDQMMGNLTEAEALEL